MLINIVNPLQKLAFGVASAIATFSTDSTGPIQGTVTAAVNDNKLVLSASVAGLTAGDFVSTEGANSAGTGPWVTAINGFNSSTSIAVASPAARTAVSGAVMTRMERIEARFRPSKITLTNLTNGDVFVWDKTLLDNQAYKTSGGATTTITNAILPRTNCVGLHPNILPASCNFSLKCEYAYRA